MTPYRRKLALAILIWTAGAAPLVVAAIEVAVTVLAPVDEFTAPGAVATRLDRGDERAILFHVRGSDLGTFKNDDVRASELDCVARSDGGRAVRARRIGQYSSFQDDDVYVAKVAFTAPASGRYVVRCDLHSTAIEHAPLGLSRQAHVGRAFLHTFAALAFCAATIMAGVVLMRRARRERDAEASPTRP